MQLFLVVTGYHDTVASWAVHIKNHAPDLVSLIVVVFLMSKDSIAVGMWACLHCRTPVLKNH